MRGILFRETPHRTPDDKPNLGKKRVLGAWPVQGKAWPCFWAGGALWLHLAKPRMRLTWYSWGMAEHPAPINERIAAAWPDILRSIADGDRVDLTCQRLGFERNQLWRFWSKDPQRRAEWYDAHKDSADAIIDKAIQAAECTDGNAKAARVKVSLYQWLAEKRDPDRFGQRTRADINVKTVDLTAIIQDANNRLAAAKQGRIIDVTPSNSSSPSIRAHAAEAITAEIARAADLY